jgi:hypothetical protein
VFSTDHIDSLALGGRIKDAYDIEAEPFVSVIYEVNTFKFGYLQGKSSLHNKHTG